MPTKTMNYIHQALAASGFVVMDSNVAWKLRPDLWSSAQECGVTFQLRPIANVERLTAQLAGISRPVLILTRSTDMLAKRIEWITGFKVEKLEWEIPEARPAANAQALNIVEQREAEKRAKLEALAAQEPPTHDCPLRKEIISARMALARQAA